MRILPTVALCTTLLGLAVGCDAASPFTPDLDRVVTERYEVGPGLLELSGRTGSAVVTGDDAGAVVRVSTLGSAYCVRPAPSLVERRGATVHVVVRDTTYYGGCPYVLNEIPRDVAVDVRGADRVLVHGRSFRSESPYVVGVEL